MTMGEVPINREHERLTGLLGPVDAWCAGRKEQWVQASFGTRLMPLRMPCSSAALTTFPVNGTMSSKVMV